MRTATSIIRVTAVAFIAITLFAPRSQAQRDSVPEKLHTRGLFLGVSGGQMAIDSDPLVAPDDGHLSVAGRVGYGFGDYIALVVSGDLSRVDLTHDAVESEFEFAHIALSARFHPFRAWGRIGLYVEGSWVRYAATTDRTIAPATVATRMTLEGTGAAAAAGLHVFLSRALSLEASAALTDGNLTKATGSGADGSFEDIPLRSRLIRIGLTWWLGT